MLVSAVHLLVEEELDEVPEGLRAAFVAVDAELGVGLEPLLVLLDEFLVSLGAMHLGTLLHKELAQVFHLRGEHTLVVNLRQGIQLLAQLLVVGATLLIF